MREDFSQALFILKQAYENLFDFYYQGNFEKKIESHCFKKLSEYIPEIDYEELTENESQTDFISLINASRTASRFAEILDNRLIQKQDDLPANEVGQAIVLIWKVLILNYEFEDYYFSFTPEKIDYFINLAIEINNNLTEYLESRYSSQRKSEYKSRISKKLILIIICGANSLHRKHTEASYEKGLNLLEGAARYIGRFYKNEKEGLGTRGIYFYISGHLSRSSGDYERAETFFRQSAEAYSQRIVQKEKELNSQLALLDGKLKSGEINESAFEKTKSELQGVFDSRLLLTLRRCALATAFGTAYIAFSTGQVSKALDLLTLTQSVLKRNCGKIYETYVSFLCSVAKRAVSTEDEKKLSDIIADYKTYLEIFEKLIPDSPYQQRVKIEMAICFYHIGRIYHTRNMTGKSSNFLNKAERLFNEVINFSQQEISTIELTDISDTALGRKRNPRLLSESLINLTYVCLALGNYDKAEKAAQAALNEAKEIRPVLCEAFLAISRYYQIIAETETIKNKSETIKLAWDNLRKAQNYIQPFDNKLQAHTLLQMAELSLLKDETWADANLYFQRWEATKHLVEYQYCHTWSHEIQEKIRGFGLNRFFIISPLESLNMKFQEERLKDYLRSQILLLTAEQINSTTKSHLRKTSITNILVQNITGKTGVTDRGARNWVKTYDMILKVKALCPSAKEMED